MHTGPIPDPEKQTLQETRTLGCTVGSECPLWNPPTPLGASCLEHGLENSGRPDPPQSHPKGQGHHPDHCDQQSSARLGTAVSCGLGSRVTGVCCPPARCASLYTRGLFKGVTSHRQTPPLSLQNGGDPGIPGLEAGISLLVAVVLFLLCPNLKGNDTSVFLSRTLEVKGEKCSPYKMIRFCGVLNFPCTLLGVVQRAQACQDAMVQSHDASLWGCGAEKHLRRVGVSRPHRASHFRTASSVPIPVRWSGVTPHRPWKPRWPHKLRGPVQALGVLCRFGL